MTKIVNFVFYTGSISMIIISIIIHILLVKCLLFVFNWKSNKSINSQNNNEKNDSIQEDIFSEIE